MSTTDVFVYGTLRRGNGNHRLLAAAQYLTDATVTGYRMVSNGGFPYVFASDNPTDTVVGEVYRVTPQQLDRLDQLEGYRGPADPWNHYDRIPVTVTTSDGRTISVDTYVAGDARDVQSLPAVPSGDWMARPTVRSFW